MSLLAGNVTLTATEAATALAKERAATYQFTASASGTIEEVLLGIAPAPGTCTNIQLAVFTDNAGEPGTIIGVAKLLGKAPTASAMNAWTGMEGTLVSGTKYWIAFLALGGTLKVELRTGLVKSRLSTSAAVTLLESGMAWNTATEPNTVNFAVNGKEGGGEVKNLAGSATVKIGGVGKLAATVAIRSTTAVVLPASARLGVIAGLRSSTAVSFPTAAKLAVTAALRSATTVAIPVSAKLAVTASVAGLAKVIIGATGKLAASAGIGELKATTAVRVLGTVKLAVTAALRPSPTPVVIASQSRLGATAGLKGSATVPVLAQGKLSATAGLKGNSVVTIGGSLKLRVKATLGMAASVVIGATGRVTSSQFTRRGLVLYARVTAAAQVPSVVTAGQIPAVVTPPAQLPSVSEVE